MNNVSIDMTQEDINSKIAEYEKKHKNIAIAYGGDGTILDVIRQTKGDKAIIPIRNYGLCKKHADYLMSILDGTTEESLKLTLCPFLEYTFCNGASKSRGIAEVVVKNVDPTCALRFNLYVGEKTYMKNVVADGIIMSTAYGSTGYFKVLDSTSKVKVEFIRPADVIVTADKFKDKLIVKANDFIEVERVPEQVSIFGLDQFHCQECRTLRHSIVEDGVKVQDQYAI